LEDKTGRRNMLKLIAAGVIGAIVSAIKIPKARAEGEYIQVGGEYATAASPTVIKGDVGRENAVFLCEHTGGEEAGAGIFGISRSPFGSGVLGHSTAPYRWSSGVRGSAIGANGVGVRGISSAPNSICVLGESLGNATAIVAKGYGGARLQEWQSFSGSILSVVNSSGWLGIGTHLPEYGVHIETGTVGPLRAASSPPGTAPNSFIVENLTSGNFKSQFTFRASGPPPIPSANKWSFGNDVTGTGKQDFFIYDEVAAATRLFIASNGYVGIGTSSPTQMLHVAGRVKATGYDTGDIRFANSFTVTEDENAGLAFKNDAGEKIAVLDREGNFRVKGKITEDPTL